MANTLYRYAFPIPRHGEMMTASRYVQSDHTPTRNDLIVIFHIEKADTEQKSKTDPANTGLLAKLREVDGILYALNNLKVAEMPQNGSENVVVPCGTQLRPGMIRITEIHAARNPQGRMQTEAQVAVG